MCNQTEQELCFTRYRTGSVLDLYNNIITCDCFIRGVALHEYLWDAVDLHSLNIPTLNNDYKANFSVKDWTKICFFELHFSQKSGVHNLEYDQMLHAKHIFKGRAPILVAVIQY